MIVKLICEECNNTFQKKVEYISNLDWICPNCNSKENTNLIEVIDNTPSEEIILGRGGCSQK